VEKTDALVVCQAVALPWCVATEWPQANSHFL